MASAGEVKACLDGIVDSIETELDGLGCDPKAAPNSPVPSTVDGEICRLLKRAEYLLEILRCETTSSPVACCSVAYTAYTTAFNVCPA